MRILRHASILIAAFCLAPFALAEGCTDVIALSKTTSETVESSDSVESHAASFCSEYYKKDSSTKTAAYAASYKLLSASMSTGRNSESEVAAKYCSGDAQNSAKKDAYRHYVDTISKDAYQAYQECIGLSANHLSMTVDSRALLPKELVVQVAYRPTGPHSTKLLVTSSDGIVCKWANSAGEEVDLLANTSDRLKCRRDSATSAGLITVTNKLDAGGQTFNYRWSAYNEKGEPVDLLNVLLERFKLASQELGSSYEGLRQSLKGSVTAFNLNACPSGWTEYKNAYGRFVRGIDRTRALDPAGERAAGDPQEDALKAHSHSYEKMTGVTNGTGATTMMGNSRPVYVSAGTAASGETETRPKNVALLYCERM